MRVKVITLEFSTLTGCFDDAPLQDFINDKHLLNVRDHFFLRNEVPYLALVVTYQLSENGSAGSKGRTKKGEDWRKLISEDEIPLFNSLREWRAERAKRDGIPPYIICNNRQLAHVVKERPSSLTQLSKIDGFGEAKLKKYGEQILRILNQSDGSGKDASSDAQTTPEEA